ncbi:hypothetical protein ACHAWF_010552 [Thalassiosira exigua]
MASGPTVHCQAFLLLRFLFVVSRFICDAQLLSAYEQAYGPWSIKLSKHVFRKSQWQLSNTRGSVDDSGKVPRGRWDRRKHDDNDLQLIFPEVLQPKHADLNNDDTPANINEDDEKNLQKMRKARHRARSVSSVLCTLNLEKNGKFTLSLMDEDGDDDKHHHSCAPRTYQPLRGEWFLTPNPYCVTDRHYDTLLLVSEARMRRRASVVEKATVELRCKVWGRYGAGAVRERLGIKHGRVRGRMTHGTVLIVKDRVNGEAERLPVREVVATFRGRAIVDLDSEPMPNDGDELTVDEEDEDDEGFFFEDDRFESG